LQNFGKVKHVKQPYYQRLHLQGKPLKEKNVNDERLIQGCKKGSQSAQRDLYDRFSNKMLRICLRYVKNEFDAEDVIVKGFMKVFSHIGKFEYRGAGSLEGWIKRIMVNESLMFLRKKNNFNLVSSQEAAAVESEATADKKLAAEDIYALVMQLPTGYRTVFNLYAIEGYSHKEIGEMLEISENTSKSQLSKARSALKVLLSKNGIKNER